MARQRRLVSLPLLLACSLLLGGGPVFSVQKMRPCSVWTPSKELRKPSILVPKQRLPGEGRHTGLLCCCDPPETKRSSFDSSPDWVKSIVAGLTSIVNIFGENAIPSKRARQFENIEPDQLYKGVKADFEDRQYLWSGDIDAELYDEGCTFTDPTLSFQGLEVFEKNLDNLRPILDSVVPSQQRRCTLHKLERQENGKLLATWTMIGNLSLPWAPRILLGGRTTYTPGADGRIVSYDEMWDISAGEALAQIIRPGAWSTIVGAEHWKGRKDGVPPPDPKLVATNAPPFVLLPGFGNDAEDYVAPFGQDAAVGLQACMARRGCSLVVSPVPRIGWLQVFLSGLMDENFRAGNGTAPVAFGWYLDLAKELVEETFQASNKRVVLVGHSAGGWLARALMQREGKEWMLKHVRGLVSLGSPHLAPPSGVRDMTQGCLTNLNREQPGAFFKDEIFYITVAGDAVIGVPRKGNIPILELIQSASPESTAYNSYFAVCGQGNVTGDGVVPLAAAHLDGASQLTISGCLHSINIAGTTIPTDESYLCERFIDVWLEPVLQHVQ